VDPPDAEAGVKMRLLLFLLVALSAGAQQRIVSLSAPATETLYAIGAAPQLVGVNETSVFPEQVMQDSKI
jgi:ABC-type hemin transport system substrate-binding protein